MKGDPQVVALLNSLIPLELTAAHQYFLQARLCANWGLPGLAKAQEEEAAEEQGHARLLMDRILFLRGCPVMDRLPVQGGKDVPEQFCLDLAFEQRVRSAYLPVLAQTAACGDTVTRTLLEKIQTDTEGHINWLETQISLIGMMGLPTYLQQWLEVD